uniref:EF-hand domain-containing protein n=1 Tax=Panagrolaimus superbus TaxID=310955 RepID=A0A914YPI8_9BILA
MSGLGDTSILNISVAAKSPDIVEQEDIQNILKFIKEYKEDEKLQLSNKNLQTNFQPKGISAWASVPSYITRRIRNKIWEADDKDIPSSADLAKCLSPAGIDKKSVDYDEFLVIHSNFPESIKLLYNPQVIWEKLISEADAHGRIPVSAFHEIYATKCDFLRCRMGLESFSYEKPGYLSYDELLVYIKAIAENYKLAADEQPSLQDIAVEVFSEIIFFKAAGSQRDYAKITDILVSNSITNFFEVVNSNDDYNYLTLVTVKKVYDRFTNAEPDDLNRLSRQQICRLFDSIVPTFWDRYFELYCPEDKMYFVDFYKISYMLDNLLEPKVIRIFFRALDLDNDGIFSIEDYKPFHSQLMPAYCSKYGNSFDLDYVYSSLFDLALAKNEITVKNLINIQQFDNFFGMICDIEMFAKLEGVDEGDEGEEIEGEGEEVEE